MFIGLCGTFLHANSTVKRQVSLKVIVFTFLLTTCTSVSSFVFVGLNLCQLTTFSLFRFSSSYVLLINIVACVY